MVMLRLNKNRHSHRAIATSALRISFLSFNMTGSLPTIPEYFSGKCLFVTGATGFIGKVLIEKLLRSCPDISKIFVLVRLKKNKSVEERIKAMTDLPVSRFVLNSTVWSV